MFSGMDALMQTLRRVLVQHGHTLLADDGPGIHPRIHQMHRAACHFYPMIQRLFPAFQPGKRRQQRGMNIDDAAFESLQEIALQHPHEAGKHDQIHPGILQRRDKRLLGCLVQFGAEFARRHELRRQLPFARLRQDPGRFDVTQNQDDFRRDLARRDGVRNRDKVGAFAGTKNADAEGVVHPVSIAECVGNSKWKAVHCKLAALVWVAYFFQVKKNGRPDIPRKTVYRLSIYLRCLARLRENRIGTVSSEALAKAAGVKPTQLRKDLAYFGTFGTRGLGYDVADLSRKISDELGTSRLQPVILVGVGNLGLALLSYRGFEKEGFEIVAAFDGDPQRKRDKEIKQPIFGMDELPKFVGLNGVRMAILSVPAAVAQAVANQLIDAGVTGILNFAPMVLTVPEDVMVNNVNLAIELENLSYFIQS